MASKSARCTPRKPPPRGTRRPTVCGRSATKLCRMRRRCGDNREAVTSRSQCLALLVSYPDGLAAMAGLTRTMMVLATRGQDWAERTRRLVWKLVVVIQRRRPKISTWVLQTCLPKCTSPASFGCHDRSNFHGKYLQVSFFRACHDFSRLEATRTRHPGGIRGADRRPRLESSDAAHAIRHRPPP